MFGKIQLYALIALGFVLGLLGIYFSGVARGQDKIKRKMDEKLIEHIRTAKDIDDEIDTLTDTSLADRASEWVRKDHE